MCWPTEKARLHGALEAGTAKNVRAIFASDGKRSVFTFQYTTDAKSDRRFCRFIDRAKLLSNGRANWIDAVDVVDLSSWLPRRQIVAASTVRRIKIQLIIFD
ncbi:hypothetical protein PCANC_20270 [Puccinia coronata f. sp. avenae]|uniref:Uncharacterized protein n=1 Tax=Puccinia coronata f. sp. avenae TaxID=200324 RepID=A0A2N5SL13_9BASI|nr:hypothetical protein PCANC_20270 [Puccinia coronata f. sp. avenae]